jgi:3-oxoacyl-[acyl-carrier-protein] synthase II
VNRDVVVSGLGAVAPHGDDPQALFEALMAGRSAVREFAGDTPRPAAVAAAAFDETRWFTMPQPT